MTDLQRKEVNGVVDEEWMLVEIEMNMGRNAVVRFVLFEQINQGLAVGRMQSIDLVGGWVDNSIHAQIIKF